MGRPGDGEERPVIDFPMGCRLGSGRGRNDRLNQAKRRSGGLLGRIVFRLQLAESTVAYLATIDFIIASAVNLSKTNCRDASWKASAVLQILMISQILSVANTTAGQISYGTEKHRSVAKWSSIEAFLNLSLSILLAKSIGIYGVAWGTSIAATIIQLSFWPRFVRRELGVPHQDIPMGRLGKDRRMLDSVCHHMCRRR